MAPPTPPPSPPAGSGHLDDLALNAHLDGDADHAGHLAVCDRCRSGLTRLRAVRAAIAVPPTAPDPTEADSLIATALAAWGDTASSVGADEEAVEATAPVVALARRRQRRITWLAAAAVVLVALVAVPLLSRSGERPEDSAALRQTAGGPMTGELEQANDNAFAAADSAEGAGGGGGDEPDDGAAAALPAGPVDDGDIGDHDDVTTVAGIMRSRLEGPSAQAPTAPPATIACEERARSRQPGLGELAYVANLRWNGTPAEVLAFRSAEAPERYELVILARPGCEVLARAQT